MQKFLIESKHDLENCKQAIKDTFAAGYLNHFEWGCKDDNHTAWAIVEAETVEDARQMIPWYLRDKAKITRLVKFDLIKDELHIIK